MKHHTTIRLSNPSLRSRRVARCGARAARTGVRSLGRSGLAALQLSIAALLAITLPDSLKAAPDAGTPAAGTTMTFSGNQSAGITNLGGIDFTIPPTITIHVQALTLGIMPAAGTTGIYMVGTAAAGGTGSNSDPDDHATAGGNGAAGFTLTLSYDGSQNILTSASGLGIDLQSTGGAGGTGGYSPRATLNPGGDGGLGGVGGDLTLTTGGGLITTSGDGAIGIFASSVGGKGGDGGGSDGSSPVAGNGNTGGNGGTVSVTNHTNIVTSGVGSTGIFAQSVGGKGGTGGYASGDLDAGGGAGGIGGTGGSVLVDNYGNITIGSLASPSDYSQGILAQSVGGAGGNGGGGDGGIVGTGGAGRGSGPGGQVDVTNRARIETFGLLSNGILAQSIGGFAGSGGGSSGLIVAFGGGSDSAGAGGAVNVTTTTSSIIITHGTRSNGIIAQSIGGGGGAGGSGGGLVGFGGGGSGGGAGGGVHVNAGGYVFATGENSIGIFAQSVGGGGGDGGTSGGVFSVGGNGSSTSPGGDVRVASSANVISASNAILAQSVGGGGGNGGSSGGWFSFGGSGGGGGAGGSVAVTSSTGNLATSEANASAIFAQSVGGGGGNGGNSTAVGLVVSVAIGGNGAAGGAGGDVQVGYNPDTGIIDGIRGTITTQGDRARGIQAQSVGGGGGNGGFAASIALSTGSSISLGIGGAGGGGGDAGNVDVYVSGAHITTQGVDAHGVFAQSVGGGGGSGGFSISASAGAGLNAAVSLGGKGGAGGSAGVVNVTTGIGNQIITYQNHSYGILAQSVGGGGGDGGFSIAVSVSVSGMGASLSFGGAGGVAGAGAAVTLNSHSDVTTHGDDSHGIFAQSVGGGGGSGGFSVAGSLSPGAAVNLSFGGSGGGGGDAGEVTLFHTEGTVRTGGNHAYGLLAQSIGGSGGDGGFSVSGSISAAPTLGFSMGGGGGTASAGLDVSLTNDRGSIFTTGENSHAVFAQSLGGGGGSGGFSVAASISIDPTGGGGGAAVNASIGGTGGAGGDAGAVVVNSVGGTIVTGELFAIGKTGNHSYGILAQSVGGGGGDGGFSIGGSISSGPAVSFSMGGNGGAAGIGGTVHVDSSTTITTHGNDSHALFAQSVGGGGGSGGFSVAGSISVESAAVGVSIGGAGAGGGKGGDVQVGYLAPISGTITTFGQRSDGILAQSIGGGGGDGGFSVAGNISQKAALGFSMGGGGGTASNGGYVVLNNAAQIHTSGSASNAILAQSVGGGGGNGGFSANLSVSTESAAIGASVGGDGAGGGNGLPVTVVNTGSTIGTGGNFSNGILAQSVGGGGGNGGFSLAGGVSKSAAVNVSVGGSGGFGGGGGAVTVNSSSNTTTTGQVSHGILAQSVGGGGGNGGFSLAGSVSAESSGVSFSMGGSGGVAGSSGVVDVTNSGAITTGNGAAKDGKGSYGILAQSVGGGGGTGGFSGAFSATLGKDDGNGVSVSIGGAGGTGKDGLGVTVRNTGVLTTTADDSIGIFAQSIGGGGGNGGFSLSAALSAGQEKAALAVSIGGSGGSGGSASTVTVTNGSQIFTSGVHSQGILAQSVGGGGGNGGFSVALGAAGGDKAKSASVSVGGAGGTGLGANTVTVTNTAGIITIGNDSSGIQAQSIGGGGGNGGFAISGSMAGTEGKTLTVAVGGGGGTGGIGGEVDVLGTGGANSIGTSGDRSHGIFAQSVGGGGGNGGFSAAVALGLGGTDPNKSSTSISVAVGGGGGTGETGGAVFVGKTGNVITGDITTNGQEAIGIFAQSIGGGGGAGGFSMAGSINLAAGQEGPNNNLALSVGGKGGTGNNAGTVDIHHSGSIVTDGDGSHGIQAQSIGGGGGNGGSARAFTLQLGSAPTPEQKEAGNKNKALSLAIGGNGGGASSGGVVTVVNTGDITTYGGDAYGIFAQSIGGGGGNGGDAHQGIPGSFLLRKYDRAKFTKNLKIVVGGSGGSSGSGEIVNVTNTGNITTYGDGSHAVFAQSIGGGGGTGGAGDVGLLGTIGIGGATNSTGDGRAVNVTINGNIETSGNGANGIFAQSIGGGGGMAGNVDRGLKNYLNVGIGLAFGQGGGNGGDGGVVTVQTTGNITTHGTGSAGILAQSIGGGGGVVGSLGNDLPVLSVLNFAGSVGGAGSGGIVNVTHVGNITTLGDASDGIFAQSAGGLGMGGAVNIKVTGDILASGAESNGIFGQSIGGAGTANIDVQIMSGTVQGGTGTGSGVYFKDGKDNKLTNHGTVQTLAGMGGTSIFGGDRNETVDNFGTVNDSLDLGTGTNTFNNKTGGLLQSGDFIKLGAVNALNNAGTISPGGVGTIETTALTGNFVQTGNAIWDFDINAAPVSDRFDISGPANLGAFTNTVNLNALGLLGTGGTWTLITAPSGMTGAFEFGSFTGNGGVMPVGYTFTLVNSPTDEKLTMAASTGPFYWRGTVSNAWNGAFQNGESNWTSDAAGTAFIFGTPAAVCDVFIATTNATLGNLTTVLGADFTINSLTFTTPNAASVGGANTLTINSAAGITVEPGAGPATISANIALGSSQSWTNNSGSLFSVSGSTVSGSGKNLTIEGSGNTQIGAAIQTDTGALTKNGTGALTLSGTNTFTGNTTVNDGTLSLQNGAAIADSVAVIVAAPGTLNLLTSETIGSLEGSGFATLNAQTLTTGGNNATTTFSGTISGAGGSLVKEGTGTFTLTGPNAYTGGTTVAAGTLRLGDGITPGAALGTGDVAIDPGATLTFDLANGEVFSNFITNNGHVVADDVPPSDYTIASVIIGSGDFTKIGINTVTVTGTNSYTGGTTAAEGTLVAGNVKAFGNGNLTLQGGTLRTTNGPLAVDIGAGNILFSGGNFQANVGGTSPGVTHDQLKTIGSANFAAGTISLVQLNGYLLQPGDKVVLIAAADGVAGGSANGTAVSDSRIPGISAFSNTPLMIPTVNLYTTSIVFEAMQGSFGSLSGTLSFTPNQGSVADALDSLLAITGGKTGIFKELDYLDTQPLSTLASNLDKMSPEELTAVFQLAKSLANIQSANVQRRLDEIRALYGDIVPINSVNVSTGGMPGPVGRPAKSCPIAEDERWGMWFAGSGEFTHIGSTTNAAGFNLDSGGVTAGVDYRFTDKFAAGISIGYMNTTASLSNGGKLDVDGGRVGAYATYFDRGFHVDASVSGGPNSYKSRRTTPNNTVATASPEGTEVNLLLATGYDWKLGGLTIGPTASFQYTNTELDGFTESGSFAPLSVIRRNADSMRTALGVKATYDWKVGRRIIRPEVRAAWQHEFADTSYSLTSTFATLGGSAFTVAGPSTGRDSLLVGAGLSIQWNNRFSTYAYYDGELLRTNYSSNNVSVGCRWRF